MQTPEVKTTGLQAVVFADIHQSTNLYEALGDNMRERIHALTMETLTPEQYRSQIVSLEEG